MRITVTFDPDGNLEFVRCPAVAFLEQLGTATHRRASHIVPANHLLRWVFCALRYLTDDASRLAEFTRRWPCWWRADLRASGGPILGPYRRRTSAIAAEVNWIEQHVL